MSAKDIIVTRAAKFFKDGDVVNLGIGMPTMIMAHIPEGIDVWCDSENGVLGLEAAPGPGEERDHNIVDASGDDGTLRPGAVCFGSFESFGLIRGGHVAYTVLGAYEVDEKGNLANWMVPGKTCAGMGGAMDLVTGAKNVLVTMTHTDKAGNAKIKKACTLPLTGAGVVTNIITELCVIDVTPEGLVLRELAPGVTAEDVQAKTEATLIIPDEIGTMY